MGCAKPSKTKASGLNDPAAPGYKAVIARQFAFARRVPPRKIAARLLLQAKRHVLSRASGVLPAMGMRHPAPPLADALPQALFDNVGGSIEAVGNDAVAFTFLGERRDFTFPIDWHARDMLAGKHLWLMNLHYMEYLAGAEDALFERLVLDWIAGNPSYCAAYWLYNWNSYAVSIRMVSLMSEVARRRARIAPQSLDKIVRSLWNQTHFLARNLESDIRGNHIIKNIKALAWASAFFSGNGARRWRELAIKLLDRELTDQILPDGMHFERSPSYHSQVFADLLEIRHVLGGDPLGGRLDARLSLMAQALADLTHGDGGVALFNDAGIHMSYSPAECLHVWSEMSGETVSSRERFALLDAGYFGVRKEGWYFVADMGPIGPEDLPAHAHGDVGSFELSVGRHRLIVDQGVFEYSPGALRRLSRTAASHNVLHIEGGDQAEFFSSFRCGRMPVVKSSYRATPAGFVLTGAHDGYSNLEGRPLVERSIEIHEHGIRFGDRIIGACAATASISLLLHPDVTIERVDSGFNLICGSYSAFALVTDLQTTIEDAVYWPDMGVECPTQRIRLHLSLPAREARWELRYLGTGTSR